MMEPTTTDGAQGAGDERRVKRAGRGSLEEVHTVLLLREGSLGVIGREDIGDGSSVTPFVAQE